jgi:hypothetical protein
LPLTFLIVIPVLGAAGMDGRGVFRRWVVILYYNYENYNTFSGEIKLFF